MRASDIGYFCHGTTVGTNALLEGKGVTTGLLVTEGFRGIYPVGEQARPYGAAIFDVLYDKPPLLVPPSRTGEVKERVDFRGNVLRALDETALRATVRELAAQGIESVAVCLLFSFLHPEHEERVREIIARGDARAAASRSPREVLPQIREYYRLARPSSTPISQPILARYIAHLDQRLGRGRVEDAAEIHHAVERRHGDVRRAREAAVTTVLSGPAGGVTASVRLPDDGIENLITFDMGGTSCDVALIKDGEPLGHEPRQDRRPRHRASDDRHQHGQRGRRHPRRASTASACSKSGRRARAPCPGRPAMAAAATSPPSPTAISCSAISARTISSAAR